MKTIREFFHFSKLAANWKGISAILFAGSLVYCAVYTLLINIVTVMGSSLFYYAALYLIAVAAGIGYMSVLFHILQLKRGDVGKYRLRDHIGSMFLIQTIYNIVLIGTFIITLQVSDNASIYTLGGMVSILLAMLYPPLQIFSIFQLYDGNHRPFGVIAKSFVLLLKHYQSVFYSMLLMIAAYALLYGLMDACFGISYVFLPAGMAVNVLTINPLLTAFTWFPSALQNGAIAVAVVVSAIYGILLCALFSVYFTWMACVYDGDVRV